MSTQCWHKPAYKNKEAFHMMDATVHSKNYAHGSYYVVDDITPIFTLTS